MSRSRPMDEVGEYGQRVSLFPGLGRRFAIVTIVVQGGAGVRAVQAARPVLPGTCLMAVVSLVAAPW